MKLRPVYWLAITLLLCLIFDGLLLATLNHRLQQNKIHFKPILVTVSALGLSDLCIATEARYTRHPAVSDPVVPFMDYPGAVEHFPTGSFWAPLKSFKYASR
jgi:hypothetical protein